MNSLHIFTRSLTGAQGQEAFYRALRVSFPARGTYEIRVYRNTANANDTRVLDRLVYVALQSIRPEQPVRPGPPVALASLRVKATKQLSGALDSYNAVGGYVGIRYDAANDVWVEGNSKNCADVYVSVLRSSANVKPVPDSRIDYGKFKEWHAYCVANNLTFNRFVPDGLSLGDLLMDIAAAGNAASAQANGKRSVVIDNGSQVIVDHLSERNARDFRWSHSYADFPDGFRVTFLDETNDFKPAERVIPWPGHVGTVNLAEDLPLPGVTNPDQVWKLARRKMYEAIHRPTTYSCVQDGVVHRAVRGDVVNASFSAIDHQQANFRVTGIQSSTVSIDGIAEMVEGQSYSVRYFDEASQLSVLRAVNTVPGDQGWLNFSDGQDGPPVETILHFCTTEKVGHQLIIQRVEPGENNTRTLHMLDAAPIIEQLVLADIPPVWNGRVGTSAPQSTTKPSAPVLTNLRTLATYDGLFVSIIEGAANGVPVLEFKLYYKINDDAHQIKTVLPGGGGTTLEGLSSGDTVALSATAVGINGQTSADSNVVSLTIASPPAP